MLVSDDGASLNYVGMKVRLRGSGFGSTTVRMKASTTEPELLAKIDELNSNDAIDRFIVQLPLPSQINENNVILAIDPKKDVDGFCPENVGTSLGLRRLCRPRRTASWNYSGAMIETEGKSTAWCLAAVTSSARLQC